MKIKINKNFNLHIIALLIFSVYYLFSLLIFDGVVINPHDNLDHLVVYDHIIGKVFNGDFNAVNNLLSGTIKWFYIENIFYPFNLLHLILDDKEFYFISEILKKILSYFTFYLLAKSLTKNKFNSFISAIVYSSVINLANQMGFGIIMMPYLLYLLTSKSKLKTKHFLIIALIGLNSSLARDYLALILLIPISIIIRQSIKNISIIFYYFTIITISTAVAGLPIVLNINDLNGIHRVNNNSYGFTGFLNYFNIINFTKIYFFPKIFLFNIVLLLSFFLKKKKIIFLSIFCLFIYFLSFYINPLIKNYIFSFLDFIKGFNFTRIDRCLNLIVCIILVYNLKYLNSLFFKKLIYFLSILTVITISLSYPIFVATKVLIKNSFESQSKYEELKKIIIEKNNFNELKNFLSNEKNYKKDFHFSKLKSPLTFDGYYKFEGYKFIKSIVEQERVMSIGIDPMIAVMNDIKVIDGYHTIYSKSYKINFRKIISKELEANEILKNYYDIMGNRVYAFYSDKNKLLLNFKAAKTIGAEYVISAFPIKNPNLESICHNCRGNKDIFLYKIL
jgi:hypothetical protein